MCHQIKISTAGDFNFEDEMGCTGGFKIMEIPTDDSQTQINCNVQLQIGDESPSSMLRLPDDLAGTNIDNEYDFLHTKHLNDNLDGCFELMRNESSDDSELTNNYANSCGIQSESDELFFPLPHLQENEKYNRNNDSPTVDKKSKRNVTYLITHSVDGITGSKPHGGHSNSKNAIAARDNRLKKKRYVAGLEETIRDLKNDNEHLSLENKKNKKTLMVLKNEVSYLRSVIANQTTLAAILRNVSKTPGIKLSTSFLNEGPKNLAQNNAGLDENANEDLPYTSTSSINSNSYHQVNKRRTLRSSNAYSLTESQKNPKQKYQKRKLKETHLVELSKSRTVKYTSRDYFKDCIETNSDGCFSQDFEDNIPINVEDTDSDESSELLTTDTRVAAGICFHVSGENVSLELCSQCNASAHTEIISDHFYAKI